MTFFNKKLISALLIAAAAGSFGCKGKMGKESSNKAAATKKAETVVRGLAAGENDSTRLPIGDSYVRGPADAPITIVEFSDFECPFCSRGTNTIHELMEKYPDKIRLVFKHYPLPFHKNAPPASWAALAAGEQGKFWEMHDKLFENQKELSANSNDLKSYFAGIAKSLGLDQAKFEADYDKISKSSTIKDDMDLGSKVGVSGTPAFFINGTSLVGAQPLEAFEKAVKDELSAIEKLGGNVAKNDLYKTRVEANFKEPKAPEAEKPRQVIEHVPVNAADPVKGNAKDALVTIVEFSDFECPFCSRVNPTIADVMKNFGDSVRVIFKQNPLSFHKGAEPAARAALAAGKQGKFWEMHDKLFEHQKEFGNEDTFTKLAKEIGLNEDKFKKDFDSDELKKQVKDDLALGAKVGARGTPNFFINGVQLVGAQPYPAFESLIKEQIEVAKKVKADKNLSGEELYEEVVKVNKSAAPKQEAPDKPQAKKVDLKLLEQGKAYAKGPENAPITIVEFSDFQCPFCSRGTNTLNSIYDQYKDKIRVVFKNYPLPFHKGAEPAARAALAAGKQGKFWEMHDKLFENAGKLNDPTVFETFAKELGLNLDKFKKDFDSDELKQQVKDDMTQGTNVGVNGTPAFFINGVSIVGAQPETAFKAVIDEILKEQK